MVKKLYICRECGYVYPEELSEYIENRIQVFCERCGTPFSLEGVSFKRSTPTPPNEPKVPYSPHKRTSKLSGFIKFLNKISYLPLLIFGGIVLGSTFQVIFFPYIALDFLIKSIIIGLSALLISLYDINRISLKVKEEKYDEIGLDSFCYGILGCFIFGTGVILLIKGIFVIIYVMANPKEEKNKVYHFGLKLKNSINYFSAKAGLIIILFVVFMSFEDNAIALLFQYSLNYLNYTLAGLDQLLQLIIITTIIIGFSLIPLIILIIDLRMKKKIAQKQIFSFGDAIGIFVLGIFGTAIFGIGIFILLKGILLFLLFIGKPIETETFERAEIQVETPKKQTPQEFIAPVEHKKLDIQRKEEVEIAAIEDKEQRESVEEGVEMTEEPIYSQEGDIEKEISQEPIEPPKELDKSSEVKLKLHESLLPVKNEKDKKLVREYFSKIFNVLSKDLRDQIKELNIPKKERKELLKELAFLNKQEQEKYIRAIIDLYKELPIKLIERIRKLPNIKPQYYEKVIEQLKFMDDEEQLEFVHFLEKNA
ncbi:MAG: hypothetical protein EU531_09395 [Promethearchaeota archaeon]|nr:MAG: hypothetical protein EU531_09395 [Candidatus Lokiarchaeota archaeon]